jgi:hypothetical protein
MFQMLPLLKRNHLTDCVATSSSMCLGCCSKKCMLAPAVAPSKRQGFTICCPLLRKAQPVLYVYPSRKKFNPSSKVGVGCPGIGRQTFNNGGGGARGGRVFVISLKKYLSVASHETRKAGQRMIKIVTWKVHDVNLIRDLVQGGHLRVRKQASPAMQAPNPVQQGRLSCNRHNAA